nr:flavodoxin [uncultured Dorea sp.]
MKRFFALILAVTMMLTLAACQNSAPAESVSEGDSETANSTNVQTEGDSHMLVAYFSLAGEQYGVGVIEEGNTSIIAHMIAEQTGADLFEIEAVTPYPTSQSELLEVSQQEMADNARPEIAGTVDNMEDYDTIFIGYPNWWGDMPMIVYNFLESYDLSDKTIVPFCTHGGSGLSNTESTIADITDGTMKDGFAIPGTTAQNDRDTARSEVTKWLKEGGVVE